LSVFTDPAKIIGGLNQPNSKVLLPNPVNNASPSELIFGMHHPIGQRDPAISFQVIRWEIEGIYALHNSGNRSRPYYIKWASHITSIQDTYLSWLSIHMTAAHEISISVMNIGRIYPLRFREGRDLSLQCLHLVRKLLFLF
jgi:hypothetical protein